MEIYLIRHTSVGVPKGLCYGRTDVPLSENFLNEAAQVKLKIPELKKCFTSPLSRCVKLSEEISSDFIEDSRILELDFGNWENKVWNEIPKHEIDDWFDNFPHSRPHLGESLFEMKQRVLYFWEEIRKLTEKTIGIVTHMGVIRILLTHILEMPDQKMFSIESSYGGVSKITLENKTIQINYINR